jgi:hypothetical protein
MEDSNPTKTHMENDIAGRLARLARMFRVEAAIRGITANIVLLLAWVTGILFLDAIRYPPALTLILLLSLAAGFQIAAVIGLFIRPLVRSANPEELARRLDRRVPAFAGRLVAAVEELQGYPTDRWKYSTSLKRAAIGSAAILLDRTRDEVVRRRLGVPEGKGSPLQWFVMVVCVLALVAGLVLERPVSLISSAERIRNPIVAFRAERIWDLKVVPGDVVLMKGDSLAVRVHAPEDSEDLEPYIQVRWKDGAAEVHPMSEDHDGSFGFRFASVESDVHYGISEGRRKSPDYRVRVIEPPGITDLTFRVVPPPYTGLSPSETSGDRKDFFALIGSNVEVVGRGSRDLGGVDLEFFGGGIVALPLMGDRDFNGGFQAMQSDSFRVIPVDRSGIRGDGGPIYSLRVMSDRDPKIRILQPGAERELDRSLEANLQLEAGDDFGLKSMRLEYSVESQDGTMKNRGSVTVATFERSPRDTLLDFRWSLDRLGLFPGDRVRYRVRVRDNDSVSGPKESRSRDHILYLPSLSDVFSRHHRELEESVNDVGDLVERTNRLKSAVESLEREMAVVDETDWEGIREAEEIVRKQETIARELRSIGDRFNRAALEMKEDERISPELLRRIEEISHLFQEVATPEMIAAIEELKRALETLDPSLIERSLDRLQFSEDEFRNGLEKTYRALQKLQMEQRLETLSRMAAELENRQNDVNHRLRAKESPPDPLRKREEEIARDTESFGSEMKTVSEELEVGEEPEASRDLSRLAEEMSALDLPRNMRHTAGRIGEADYAEAESEGREIAGKIGRLREGIERIRMGMTGRWRRDVEEVLDRAIEDLLSLSQSEERLASELLEPGSNGPTIDTFINEQGSLTEGLEGVASSLYQSAEESYYIGREAGSQIGRALNLMRRSARQVESQGKGDVSVREDVTGAVRNLNGAILSLMQDRRSMSNSSSGTGFEEAFQRMMEMARAQSALNEQAAGLFPLPIPGDWSGRGPLSRELLRMAAEQQRILQSLETVQDALEGGEGLLGSLDEIAREMEGVAREMERGTIRKETLDQQRRILSRLLDAEKSLRKRDDSKRREAETPKPYEVMRPPRLSETQRRGELPAEDPLFPPGDERFPKGYREAVRLYLGLLSDGEDREGLE